MIGSMTVEELSNAIVRGNCIDTDQGLATGAHGHLRHSALEIRAQ